MKDKEKNSKKKSRSGGILVILILLLVAVLLLWFKGFGLGLGGGDSLGSPVNGTIPEISETPISVAETVSTSEDEENSAYIIEVSEDSITYRGNSVADVSALKELVLTDMGDNQLFILRDNHAVKASFDEVKAMLEEISAIFAIES